jgi:outer membrane protein assembly complex protein YaeT
VAKQASHYLAWGFFLLAAALPAAGSDEGTTGMGPLAGAGGSVHAVGDVHPTHSVNNPQSPISNPQSPGPALATEQPTARKASAQDQPREEGLVIRRIEFQGLELYTEAYLLSLIRSSPGTAYSADQVRGDVRRIQQTGKFLDVYATPEIEDGQVVLTFTVAELPEIAAVQFRGNVKFKDKDLRKEITIGPGRPLDRFAIEQGRDAIENLYRTKGYNEARVTIDEAALESERIVIYQIVEGPRVRVRKILFEGNEHYSRWLLNSKISTKTYIWLFRDGVYNADQVAEDELALQSFLRGDGYLDARVSHRLGFDEKGEKLTITFLIEEGTRYAVREVLFEGNTVFADEELGLEVATNPGMYLVRERLRQDVKKVTSLYYGQGYIDMRCATRWVFAEEPGLVDLTFEVAEGEQYRVGRLVVRGNRQTKDKVVRRELRLFPGDLFDLNQAREAELRLRETGLFSAASITPVGEQPGVRDALVEVTEHERTTQFLLGVGVTSNSGVLGNIMLENRNFDLFDWPRDFKEFFRGQSFRGAGQTMRIQLEPGTELTRFRIDFLEPYLLDRELSFGTSVYFFERGRDAYDEERLGLNVSLGKRFRKGTLKDWAAEVALRVEQVDIGDVDILDARDIRDVEGNNFVTSVRGTLVHDTTNSRFVPSRGHRFRLSWEQGGALGGDFFYSRATANYRWYRAVYTDEFDRKQVLALGGRAGAIFGDAPVFERFYGGGLGSVRGFEFRGISPRQGLRDDRVGGDFLLLANAEYSFPLVGKNLRGVLFADMGTVEEDFEVTTWRASVGAGVRLTIDFFGPIPLEFDLAAPVSRDGDDDTQIFSFFFGTTF